MTPFIANVIKSTKSKVQKKLILGKGPKNEKTKRKGTKIKKGKQTKGKVEISKSASS